MIQGHPEKMSASQVVFQSSEVSIRLSREAELTLEHTAACTRHRTGSQTCPVSSHLLPHGTQLGPEAHKSMLSTFKIFTDSQAGVNSFENQSASRKLCHMQTLPSAVNNGLLTDKEAGSEPSARGSGVANAAQDPRRPGHGPPARP